MFARRAATTLCKYRFDAVNTVTDAMVHHRRRVSSPPCTPPGTMFAERLTPTWSRARHLSSAFDLSISVSVKMCVFGPPSRSSCVIHLRVVCSFFVCLPPAGRGALCCASGARVSLPLRDTPRVLAAPTGDTCAAGRLFCSAGRLHGNPDTLPVFVFISHRHLSSTPLCRGACCGPIPFLMTHERSWWLGRSTRSSRRGGCQESLRAERRRAAPQQSPSRRPSSLSTLRPGIGRQPWAAWRPLLVRLRMVGIRAWMDNGGTLGTPVITGRLKHGCCGRSRHSTT